MLAAITAAAGLSVALLFRTLRRRLRPVPHIASPAPVRWLVPSNSSARLHRRLRVVARAGVVTTGRIRTNNPEAANLAEIGDALVAEATEIDRALAATEPLAGQRRRDAVRALEQRVVRLERSTDRFCHASDDWFDAVGPHGRRAIDVNDALESVEAATRTLRQLDLTEPAEAARRSSSPS